MKLKFVTFFLMSLLLAMVHLGCSEKTEQPFTDELTELKLGASIKMNVETRATQSAFENGDSILLYISTASPVSCRGENEYRGVFRDGEIILDHPCYFPEGNYSDLNILAIYPYDAAQLLSDTSLLVDCSNMSYSPDYVNDFIVANKRVQKTNDVVMLEFYHELSLFHINFISDDTFHISTIFPGLDTRAYYDVTYRICQPYWGMHSDTLFYNGYTKSCSFIIPQQTINSMSIGIDGNYTYLDTLNIATESGKSTVLNIRVNKTELKLDAQIHDWIQGESYDKDIFL